jgi:two-component system sensor histidine kinase UhpB
MAKRIEPAVSPAAKRYIEKMLQFLAPEAGRLEAQFAALLRRPGGTAGRRAPSGRGAAGRERAARLRALQAITPAAAARVRTLPRFFAQVQYNGRRLAKLNVSPEQVNAALNAFAGLLEPVLGSAFQPAREQLRLATTLALNNAYYDVREAEAQTLFGLYRAETQTATLPEALRGFVKTLTRALRARAGRFVPRAGRQAARLARPLYVERGGASERLISSDLRRAGYASYWSYPVGDTAAVQFAFSAKRPWLPREMSLVAAAASRCGAALQRARLEDAVRRSEADAQRAEEEERRRVGRELHDEVGQSLLALRLRLELLERQAPAALAGGLRAARSIAEQSIAELRRALAALGPAALERVGLRAALRRLAGRFRQTHPCALSVSAPPACDRIPPAQAETIYRVAQECFQNIAKHSGADRVMLSLRPADRGIRLSVADNGVGFRREEARAQPMAFGLAGMRERAARMSGQLEIRSGVGKGTRVVLDLPNPAARGAGHVDNSHFARGRSHAVPPRGAHPAGGRTGPGGGGRKLGRRRGPGAGASASARRPPDGYRDERAKLL